MIRHGKPKVINNNFFEARLSRDGIRQAKEFPMTKSLPVPQKIFSSPYNRTVDTSKALSETLGIEYEIKDFLKEWNLQSLNLLDPEFTEETKKGWADHSVKVRGGESLEDLCKRAYEGILNLVTALKVQNVVLVTHGTLTEMVCAKISGREPKEENVTGMEFLDYAILEYRDNQLSLIKDISFA